MAGRIGKNISDYHDAMSGQPIDADIPDDQVIAARRTVCAYAVDAEEAAEMMRMLGIHPDSAPPKMCTKVDQHPI